MSANENGQSAGNRPPVKSISSYATYFIAVCIRFASWDAAILSAAVLLAVETIRLLVLEVAP